MQRPTNTTAPSTPDAYTTPTLKRLGLLSRFTLGGATGAAETISTGDVQGKKAAPAPRQ